MNKFLQPENAPVTEERQETSMDFDTKFEVRSKTHIVSNLILPGGGAFMLKDADSDNVLTYNPITNQMNFVSGVAGLIQESRFEFAQVNGFTGNENFEFSGPAANQFPIIQIDSTGYGTNTLWYFDVVANGDPPEPLVYRLVDLTNGTAEVGSTRGTSGTTTTATFNRVGPFVPSVGTIQYAYQQKRGGTTAVFPAVVSAAIIAHHL